MMTASAERFVGPLTFASLTGAPGLHLAVGRARAHSAHSPGARGRGRSLVAPATANSIAKLAHGIADDLLTTALLAARIPIVLAPAMNDAMYEHDGDAAESRDAARARLRVRRSGARISRRTRTRRRAARRRGAPDRGARTRARAPRNRLPGGASRSPPGRRASRSIRCASSATRRPARWGSRWRARPRCAARSVTLLLGPTPLEPPAGVDVVRVATAQEMHDAALEHARRRRSDDRDRGRRRLAPRDARATRR